MLKNGLSICWYLTVHSDKIDFTKIGIFKSWLVTGKDSIFQVFAWKKHMRVHGLPMSICGKKLLPPSKLMTPHARKSDMGQTGTLQEHVPTEVISEKWCCPAASLRREGWITLQLCRKVRLKITRWVSLSLSQADCKYYKILSGCSLQ